MIKKKIMLSKKPLVCLTAYNKFSAEIIDDYCDIILVGDSMGMAYYGNDTTRSVKLDDIIKHGQSVRKGVKKSTLVVDMPFGTYKNKISAKKNALKIIKLTKCDAVKLEGGKEKSDVINFLVKNNINVMGHIGLLPQNYKNKKKFKILGKSKAEERKVIDDLKHIQKSGVFSVVLEGVKENLAKKIAQKSKVPIIGIGASKECHGQILVLEDMLGIFQKVPKFVKKYENLNRLIRRAVKNYSFDVRKGKFPSKKNVYK